MSKVCEVSGARPKSGNNRSHSKRATKRRFVPNLITKRVFLESTGTFKTMTMTARCWRSFAKKGEAYLKKMLKKQAAKK